MLTITLIAILIAGLVLAAVPHLIYGLLWLICLPFGHSLPYAPFGWFSLGLTALFWAVMEYGIWIGRFRLEVVQTEFISAELPSTFNGYKIIHISDLHLSTFDDRPQALQRVVDSINAQHPDLVCFTGDLVSMGAKELTPYTDILSRINATDGVVSVLGNHDFLLYRRDLKDESRRQEEVSQLANLEQTALGWQLLRNSSITIRRGEDSICVLGTDNCACHGQGFHTIYAGDLQQALKNTGSFRILLTHDPSHWRAEVIQEAIPLTLCGHTHAGQVRIFGWPLSNVSFRDSQGWIYEDNKALYINRGIGCTMPIRLNCPQEITVITLSNKQ